MIITRTPLRVSLVGGGTDLPAFYSKHDGAVVSVAIDKYIYIMVNRKFDGRLRISYSKTENVEHFAQIEHDIARETLKLFGVKGLEIVFSSDVPGNGTGLGSSSAVAVGLIKAIADGYGNRLTTDMLAEIAYSVEAQRCGHPVGKQDHYAAAYGGFSFFEFKKDKVHTSHIPMLDEQKVMVASQMMLFWTGVARPANEILTDMKFGPESEESGILMAELARDLNGCLVDGQFRKIGACVNAAWQLKKKFSRKISTEWIDSTISLAKLYGAEGAKICGAGGGGFLLVIAEDKFQRKIEETLKMRRLPFRIGAEGSKVIYKE